MKMKERYEGCLMGLAVGDALGTTVEFKRPGSFPPVTDMVGGGPFSLQPGEWTDDTSMALCLAASLIEKGEFNPKDQMNRYVKWRYEGYMSSTDKCFDIGGTVSAALQSYLRTGYPYSGPKDHQSSGNGSLMRLAPIPMHYRDSKSLAIHFSGESSKTTHGSNACVDACKFYGGLIVDALYGWSKDEILSPWVPQMDIHIEAVAQGSYKKKQPPAIVGSGYVRDSLEAALWAFYNSSSFEEGCLMAVNLGDDADTTAAIYGQLAGAFYGIEGIPQKWRDKIKHKEMILEMANGLMK